MLAAAPVLSSPMFRCPTMGPTPHLLCPTQDELTDLLKKFGNFFTSLNEHQKVVIKRSLPTATEALSAFGPDVTEPDLLQLFKRARYYLISCSLKEDLFAQPSLIVAEHKHPIPPGLTAGGASSAKPIHK